MFDFRKPDQVMGILNVTPDSFSDGGRFADIELAVAHAKEMIAAKVDYIDIGGQSTRPGYQEIPAAEELQRVVPVIKAVRGLTDIPISVDTYFPEVAKAAIEAGADIINDIRGLDHPGMLELLAEYPEVGIVIMHSRPRQKDLDVAADIQAFYEEKYQACQAAGISEHRLCFDPGIGFGKSMAENIEILQDPAAFRYRDFPLLYGVSRKRTIAHLIDETDPLQRDYASVTASLYAALKGAEILRVHEFKGLKDALRTWRELASQ